MKQLVFLLLFVLGFSSAALAKPAVLVPAVTTQNLTANTLDKGGLWSKIKTKVHQFLEEGEAIKIAVIAHITIIGLVIAITMNADKKSELATFYIRQVLGISVLGLLSAIIVFGTALIPVIGPLLIAPIVSVILFIPLLVLFIMSLLSAIKGKKKEVPVVGKMFQKWFASIG